MKTGSDSKSENLQRGSEKRANDADLPDSPRDAEKLRPEETIIELPEVKDIPGQEHIHVPPLGELADITISSADEEGAGVLDELNDLDDASIRTGIGADVSWGEGTMLETADNFRDTEDEQALRTAAMDNTDFEGEALNEGSFGEEKTGADLDVPISEADDANERIGEEDEENNSYSLGSDSNDQAVEATP